MERLKDRVAIVTGAARGIGRVFARRLAREGARVVAADILDVGETLEEVRAQGGEGLGVRVDVTSFDSTREMAEKTVGAYGRIDILVNNAALYGGLKLKPFDAIPEEEWDRVFAVNVKGVWQCCRAVVPVMKRQGKGVIINISSASIIEGVALLSHYVASKGAVWALTRSLARELGEYGIRVNSITPGYTMTQASKELSDDPKLLKFIHNIALEQRIIKRPMEPEDLEGVLVFLASDDSAYITGQNINVEGGARHY
ncbi:MAG: SDR family NAD(P)-dependent oxidoreductase [Moorellales bacterium]